MRAVAVEDLNKQSGAAHLGSGCISKHSRKCFFVICRNQMNPRAFHRHCRTASPLPPAVRQYHPRSLTWGLFSLGPSSGLRRIVVR